MDIITERYVNKREKWGRYKKNGKRKMIYWTNKRQRDRYLERRREKKEKEERGKHKEDKGILRMRE